MAEAKVRARSQRVIMPVPSLTRSTPLLNTRHPAGFDLGRGGLYRQKSGQISGLLHHGYLRKFSRSYRAYLLHRD